MVEIKIRPASIEQNEYLVKLAKVCGYKEMVTIITILADDMPERVGVTDKPDGFLHLEAGKPPMIVLRDNLENDRWQSVVAHEFLHVLRWKTDEWVLAHLSEGEKENYMRLIESTMKPLHILLMVGGIINAEWVDDE